MSFYTYTLTENLTIEQFVGRRVRQLRKERGWTLDDLCVQMPGSAPSQLSRFENGKVNLTIRTLQRLAEAFGVPARELLP